MLNYQRVSLINCITVLVSPDMLKKLVTHMSVVESVWIFQHFLLIQSRVQSLN